MYSGGLDSLGATYRLLTDPEYKDYKLHIHHVHHHNIENRHRAEAVAVEMALKELERLGYSFVYSESQIASRPYKGGYMYDTDSINFFAGYICSVNPDIELIALGMQANDSSQRLTERIDRANAILRAFTDVKKIFPVLNLTKREIYDSLPESLRNMFWSCRTPVLSKESIQQCGKCKTCLQLKDAGIR